MPSIYTVHIVSRRKFKCGGEAFCSFCSSFSLSLIFQNIIENVGVDTNLILSGGIYFSNL